MGNGLHSWVPSPVELGRSISFQTKAARPKQCSQARARNGTRVGSRVAIPWSLGSPSLLSIQLSTSWTSQHGAFLRCPGRKDCYPAWSRNGNYIYFCNPMGNVVRFYRVGVENLKLEDVASVNLPKGLASGMFGSWTGLAPD